VSNLGFPIHHRNTNRLSDYVPCKTPLNMTISVNGKAIPLHPLDLTTGPDKSSQTCVGSIQAADDLLSSARIGDMILGVPFLRNVYTVLAHDVPLANGSFDTQSAQNHQPFQLRPRLGVMGLTDPGVAMDEFHTVRVLGQPLSTSGSPNGSKPPSSGGASNRGLSVGLKVLIGLVSVFALALLLFAVRFWWQRRKWNKSLAKLQLDSDDGSGAEGQSHPSGGVPLQRVQSGAADTSGLTTAQLRDLKLDEYMSRKGVHSNYAVDTSRTMVETDDRDNGEEMLVDEFGLVYFGKPGKEKKGKSSTNTLRSFPSFPDQATTVGMGIGELDEARLSRRFGLTAFPPAPPGIPETEDSSTRRGDHFRASGGSNPSESLLGSQSRSSVGWNEHPFPVVEPPLRETVGQGWREGPGMGDTMVGVGAHHHRGSSDWSNYSAQPTSTSGELPVHGVHRHLRAQSSFDHTAEDPLLPPSLHGRNDA